MHRRQHQTYALGGLIIGAVLVVSGAARAQDFDSSLQPHLKSWSNTIANPSRRFAVLSDFGDAAVLDRTTGLVWERSPALPPAPNWFTARFTCIDKAIGGHKAWRLPSIPELASLVLTTPPGPSLSLPPGHPFLNVQSSNYWSATTSAANPTFAWFVNFGNGDVSALDKGTAFPVWCVRGGMNTDQY